MSNPTIETDIAEILKDLQKGQKDILISLETVKGDIKALDTKVEQLDKRLARAFPYALRRRGVARQEFLNRGIFIGLLLALLSGLVNYFGWMPKG